MPFPTPKANRPPQRGRCAVGALLLLGVLGAGGRLHAEEPPSIQVALEGCDDASAISAEELLQALQIELAPLSLVPASPTAVDPSVFGEAYLKLSWCTALAQVTLHKLGATAPLTRTFELADTPDTLRSRTLALAVGELWRSEQPEPEPPAEPAAPPEPAPPRRQAFDDERPHARPTTKVQEDSPLNLGANAAMRATLLADTLMFGGELGLAGKLVHVGGVLLMTERDASLIDLGMGVIAGQLGFELVRVGHAPALALSARGECGATWAAGQIAGGITARAFAWLAGGHLELALEAAMSERWRGRLTAAFGYTRGMTASVDSRKRFSTDGLILGLSLGLRLRVRE